MRAKPGPPLHVAWGCSPDPRHCPEKTGAGLQGCRSEAGKREEPSPWPLTEAHLDPKSQIPNPAASFQLPSHTCQDSLKPPHIHDFQPSACPPPRGATQTSTDKHAPCSHVCAETAMHICAHRLSEMHPQTPSTECTHVHAHSPTPFMCAHPSIHVCAHQLRTRTCAHTHAPPPRDCT